MKWCRFEFGALAGLVGTPYNSGDSERDQGIQPQLEPD